MSKQIQAIRAAYKKGYRADPVHGVIYGLRREWGKPKPVKLKLKGSQKYPTFTVRLEEFEQPVRVICAHRFMAYVIFGEDALKPGVQVRHQNDNVLDIRACNLSLGSQLENAQDQKRNTEARLRLLAKLLAMISNPSLRQALYEYEKSTNNK